jgi:hypothetical protein
MQMNGSGLVDQGEERSRGVHTFNECPVVLKFTAKAKW